MIVVLPGISGTNIECVGLHAVRDRSSEAAGALGDGFIPVADQDLQIYNPDISLLIDSVQPSESFFVKSARYTIRPLLSSLRFL